MKSFREPKVISPHDVALVYSYSRKEIGLLIDGVVFYNDKSSELGLGHVFPIADSIDVLRNIREASMRHASGNHAMISAKDYAERHSLNAVQLDRWGRTELAYVLGARVVKIGMTSVVYVPDNLEKHMILENDWLAAVSKLEENIIRTLLRTPDQTIGQISHTVESPYSRVRQQLEKMKERGVVTAKEELYRLSKATLSAIGE